jgi:hypothetical protein
MTTPDEHSTETPVRSFRVEVPEADLVYLRRSVTATRWPHKELV